MIQVPPLWLCWIYSRANSQANRLARLFPVYEHIGMRVAAGAPRAQPGFGQHRLSGPVMHYFMLALLGFAFGMLH